MENNETTSPKKIVWLASYPKSGNTWFRAFLTALLDDPDEFDINEIKTDGIFSSRFLFDECTDLDSTYFYEEEVKLMQPDIFTFLAGHHTKTYLFTKIHDAYSLNSIGRPIVPSAATRCAIYILRNPLDIAASLASHMGNTLNKAIETLNNPMAILGNQVKNFNVNNQFTQLMYSWSGHVISWTTNMPFPVLTIRYEDMLQDPLATFGKAVDFIGLHKQETEIKRAIEATRFEVLREKEKETGFREVLAKNRVFFRQGQSGNYKNELTEDLIDSIITNHSQTMSQFGYI